MKKTASVLLALLLSVSVLAGCQKQSPAPSTEGSESTQVTLLLTPPQTEATDPSVSTVPATESTEASEPVAESTEATVPEVTEPEVTVPDPTVAPAVTVPTQPATQPTEHQHSYTASVIAPTCTGRGYTVYTCAGCGHSYTADQTAATGHIWGQWTVTLEPTYTTNGKEERHCAVCAATESQPVARLEMTTEQMQQEVLRLVNLEREKVGLAPLVYFSAGQAAADLRAEEIQESFSHTRPDGQSCFTVFEEFSISYYTVGENIAYGYPTPEDVVEGWMNSDGHRANILNPDFTGLAVGVENRYWVQLFIG